MVRIYRYAPPSTKPSREVYNRVMIMDRPIATGRTVLRDDFPLIIPEFVALQWLSFITLTGPIYPDLIREFFANFELHDNKYVTFLFFDRHYQMDLDTFGQVLGIPTRGDIICPLRKFSFWEEAIDLICPNVTLQDATTIGVNESDLTPLARSSNGIIKNNVYFRDEASTILHDEEIALILYLLTGRPVCMSQMVAWRMSHLPSMHSRQLPYGALLNRLFEHLHLTSPRLPHYPLPDYPISLVTLGIDDPLPPMSSDEEDQLFQ